MSFYLKFSFFDRNTRLVHQQHPSCLLGALWQIVIIIGASTLVYTPFVIASNKQEEA